MERKKRLKENKLSLKKKIFIVIFLIIIIIGTANILSFCFNDFSLTGNFLRYFKILNMGGLQTFGEVLLTIVREFSVEIISPISQNYTNSTISLNVTSNPSINMSLWYYSIYNVDDGEFTHSNLSFSPNTTIISSSGENLLIVYGESSVGQLRNDSVVFIMNGSDNAPIIDDFPSIMYVCENETLSYLFNVTDIGGDLISLALDPVDPFYVTNLLYFGTITTGQIYSRALSKGDIGIYDEIVTASDGEYSDYKRFNVSVIEINHPPTMQDIESLTMWPNESVNFQVEFDDYEDGNQDSGNIEFNISFLSGDRFFDIDGNGWINFSSNDSVVGNYLTYVCGKDRGLSYNPDNISLCGDTNASKLGCTNFQVIVTTQNRNVSILNYYPSSLSHSMNSGQSKYFNITGYDPDGWPDIYWYVNNNLVSSTLSGAGAVGIYSVSEYTFSPDSSYEGLNTIKAKVSDGISNESISWSVNVNVPEEAVYPAGGGGGGGGLGCGEKWSCSYWSTCKQLDKSLDEETKRNIREQCIKYGIGEVDCGYQTRNCIDANNCSTTRFKPVELQYCMYVEHPGCDDGIKNCHHGSCEVLVDCGGPCPPCPTCSDGIKNQGEEGIDCGGPCPDCVYEIPSRTVSYLIIIISVILLILIIIIIKKLRDVVKKRAEYHKIKKKE